MTTELPSLRRSDFSLSPDQRAVRTSFADFYARECPMSLVRSSEPMGFHPSFWRKLAGTGVLQMALPHEAGGDAAGLVELALVTEEHGRRLAPGPLIEHVVATRMLASTNSDLLETITARHPVLTIAPGSLSMHRPVLVPAAAVAGALVGLLGNRLIVFEPAQQPPLAQTLGGAPVAYCDVATADNYLTLTAGEAALRTMERARREWQLLTAAALVGLGAGALGLSVDYAKQRVAFGVPIASFQAVSHRLVDARIALEGARRLVWRAAWYLDYEPPEAAAHVAVAYLRACEIATQVVSAGIHVQGGFGFTLDSDLHLYFRRAKSWPLVAGDPRAELASLADSLLGPDR